MRSWFLLSLLLCAAAGAVDPAPDYAEEIALVRPQLAEERLILLGEMHGTREIPALVAELIDELSAGQPLVLALEVGVGEQAAFDLYLNSDGGTDARLELERSPFFAVSSDQHDGRRNRQALALIEKVRELKRRGRKLELLAFDPAGSTRDHHERDQVMAATLRKAVAAHPQARVVVLTGNVHAMRKRPGYAPPEMQQPMGSFLADLDPFAIRIGAREGEFWACRNRQCAPGVISANQDASRPTSDGVYDYHMVLPRFSVADLLGRP